MAPVIAQMSPASQGEGQLLKHPLKPVANFLRGCLKSPDSRQILSSMCLLQLPESWHEACTTFCELGIGRTFQTSSKMMFAVNDPTKLQSRLNAICPSRRVNAQTSLLVSRSCLSCSRNER